MRWSMGFLLQRVGSGPQLRIAIAALVIAVAVAEQAPLAVIVGALLTMAIELVPLRRLDIRLVLAAEVVLVTLTVATSLARDPRGPPPAPRHCLPGG